MESGSVKLHGGSFAGQTIVQEAALGGLGIPLIRLTFPIFDRHHHHRFPVWGYAGGLRVLVTILDKILDVLDVETAKTGISFDLVR